MCYNNQNSQCHLVCVLQNPDARGEQETGNLFGVA